MRLISFPVKYVPFEFLKNYKFIDFKSGGCICNLDNYNCIMEFYKLYYTEEFPPFYHILPEFNSVVNSSNFRFIIIDVSGVKVLIVYKIISIMRVKQIRVIGSPIAANRDLGLENKVIFCLLSKPFVKLVTADFNICKEFSNFHYERLDMYDDYFIDIENIHFNSKERSKRGINTILNNPDFSIRCLKSSQLTESLKFKLQGLRDRWEIGMRKNGHNVSRRNTSEFIKFINSDLGVLNIILFYKDTPISLQIILIDDVLKSQNVIYINHISRDNLSGTVFNNFSKIQVWLYRFAYDCKALPYRYVWLAGHLPGEVRNGRAD